MKYLLSTLLNPLVALPNQKESALQAKFCRLIAQSDFHGILQLYLQSEATGRQELLKVIGKSANFQGFVDYLTERPDNYLSPFFIAVMYSHSARKSFQQSIKSKQNHLHIGNMVYYAQSAYELYVKALPGSNKDVLIYSHLIDNLLLLNENIETANQYYQHALHWDANSFQLHQAMTNLLSQKGFSGRKQAFELAKKVTNYAAAGDPNLHLLPLAHIQEWLFLCTQKSKKLQQNYFKRASVEVEIEQAYSLFAEQRNHDVNSLRASQSFMFCFYMNNNQQKLAQELSFNQNYIDFSTAPWAYLGQPKLRYNLILRQCNLLPPASSRSTQIKTSWRNYFNKEVITQ